MTTDKKTNGKKTKSEDNKKPLSSNVVKFRRQFDPEYTHGEGEPISELPTRTQPDQTLTVRQLLINHSRGIPSPVRQYDGDFFGTEIPIINDLNDLHELRTDLDERQKEINDELKLISERKKEAEKRKKDLEKQQPPNEPSKGSKDTPPTPTT